jgi:hypothetical protein
MEKALRIFGIVCLLAWVILGWLDFFGLADLGWGPA